MFFPLRGGAEAHLKLEELLNIGQIAQHSERLFAPRQRGKNGGGENRDVADIQRDRADE
jgi:hypothetical protein